VVLAADSRQALTSRIPVRRARRRSRGKRGQRRVMEGFE
jgi:hypothetical protein